MQGQATINIGCIGHVAHGKSTLVKAISGVDTVKFKEEKERGCTIHLGYANAKIWKCPTCPRPACYSSSGSAVTEKWCEHCTQELTLMKHVSFVDCPGHEALMATMIGGASIMDGAILIVAANDKCPQLQTQEHLAITEVMGLKDIMVIQTKAETLEPLRVKENHADILKLIHGTPAHGKPIIPVASILGYNIDVVCEYLAQWPEPVRSQGTPRMVIVRSFNVNKQSTGIAGMKGGVIGGSLIGGCLNLGQDIEIRPGIMTNGQCVPLLTRVVSLCTERNKLTQAAPGGLIGVGTLLDPTLTKNDVLIGQMMGEPGSLPDTRSRLKLKFYVMTRPDLPRVLKGMQVTVNIGPYKSAATVLGTKGGMLLDLKKPVCCDADAKVAVSVRVKNQTKLAGYGEIMPQ
jgi:translation initiation factor 2 subunit 3